MRFNPDDFVYAKPEFVRLVKKEIQEKGKTLVEAVTNMSVSYGLPLTVSYLYVMQDMPEHAEECDAKIKELKAFYGIRT